LTTTDEVVAALGPAIAQRIGEPRYRLWFHDNTRFAWNGDCLTIGVPNRFYQEWLQNTFTPALHDAALSVLHQPVRVHFVIDPALFQARRAAEEKSTATPSASESSRSAERTRPPRRWLRLEDFVIGPCNRLAYSAALHFVEGADLIGNPLTLFGPVGVGKTHLLEGMCDGLRRRLGEAQVFFITAEEFTNRFLHALHEKKLSSFRLRFRGAQALLVDNLQFLANKQATQEEFLHTFEALKQLGRPVAVTFDCHPKLIPSLMPELVDRCLGGVVCALDLPQRETRLGILTRKAALLGSPLPDEVANFMADRLQGHVRELEGALHAVRHYSRAHECPITLENARSALADLLRHGSQLTQLSEVERAIRNVLGLDERSLRSRGRARAITQPRMLAMYLARKHTGMAYSEIGRYFGGRNHSTAISAEKKVAQWLEQKLAIIIGDQRWQLDQLIHRIERELLR
jgi:chromosomal replication initiator protein